MEENDRSPSPSRSSLPPPLHRHLRSAPQSPQDVSAITVVPQSLWSGGQRSTTDPAYYTYPPPLNTSRELVVPAPDVETTHCWQTDVPQTDVPFWDERFPPPQRIGHAESYTRADDSSFGGSYSSPRRPHFSDWRSVPNELLEGRPRYPFSPQTIRPQRALAEPSSSRFSFIPYVAVPEGLSARVYDRPGSNASAAPDQAQYIPSTASHGLPDLPSPDDFVSPLLDSVFLDVPGAPTTVDDSSSEAGKVDPVEEVNPKKVVRKGKQRTNDLLEDGSLPLRRFKKKTEIACDFCRGRKLGCSGERPKCKTCMKRRGECIYAPAPRRRGPGKAPRGSRKLAKGRGTGALARTQRSTPEDERLPFPSTAFDVPFPPIQAPSTDSLELPPTNGEESRDHRWRASSLDRALLTSLPDTGVLGEESMSLYPPEVNTWARDSGGSRG